jgi:hypothetical protein
MNSSSLQQPADLAVVSKRSEEGVHFAIQPVENYMSQLLVIDGVSVRRDLDGRYCQMIYTVCWSSDKHKPAFGLQETGVNKRVATQRNRIVPSR